MALCRKRAGPLAVVVLLIAIAVTTLILYHGRQKPLDVLLHVKGTSTDTKGTSIRWSVDESGRVYIVECNGGNLRVRICSPRTPTVTHQDVSRSLRNAIVLLPDSDNAGVFKACSESGREDALIAIDRFGNLTSWKLGGRDFEPFDAVRGLPLSNIIYAVGVVHASSPAAIALGRCGHLRWMARMNAVGGYYHAVVDRSGNLVVGGILGSDQAVVTKYSSTGSRVWMQRIVKLEGGGTIVWIGTGSDNSTTVVVRLHDVLYLNGSAQRLYHGWLHGSRVIGRDDRSGCNRDYLLFRYSSSGKLIRRQLLSHGLSLSILDTRLDNKNNLLVLGSKEDGSAQLVKYLPDGSEVWSRNVHLGSNIHFRGIEVNRTGAVYLYGDSRDNVQSDPTSAVVHWFVYRVLDAS